MQNLRTIDNIKFTNPDDINNKSINSHYKVKKIIPVCQQKFITEHSYPQKLKSLQPLNDAFEFSQHMSINASNFISKKDDVFARIASRYDFICNLFSCGIHHFWKQRFIQIVNKESWQNLLDVASGTGEIVHKLLQKSSNTIYKPVNHKTWLQNDDVMSNLIVSDLNMQMLHTAQSKLADFKPYIKFMPLDAHNMTDIDSNSQDVVTISMGLKLLNRQQALKEAFRVLKPQGRLINMEISTIPIGWLNQLYLKALSKVIPLLAKLTVGSDVSIYSYLLEGIKNFPDANELAKEIRDIGFVEVEFERMSMGIVAIHTARKM